VARAGPVRLLEWVGPYLTIPPCRAAVTAPVSPDPAVRPVATARPGTFDAARALQMAQRTFEIEARALLGLAARQGTGFP
jgi:hypothetical protein